MNRVWWFLLTKVEREDYLKAERQEKFLRAKGEGYSDYMEYIKRNTPRRSRPDTTLCFYDMGTEEHNAWRLGWLAAEREEEQRMNDIVLGPMLEDLDRAIADAENYRTFGEWLQWFSNEKDKTKDIHGGDRWKRRIWGEVDRED